MELRDLICTEDILKAWAIRLGKNTYWIFNEARVQILVYHDAEEEKIVVIFYKGDDLLDTIYFYDKGESVIDFFKETIPTLGRKLNGEDVYVPRFNKRVIDSLI